MGPGGRVWLMSSPEDSLRVLVEGFGLCLSWKTVFGSWREGFARVFPGSQSLGPVLRVLLVSSLEDSLSVLA